MKEFKNYCKHGFAYNTYVTGNDKLFPNSKDEMNKKEEELLEEETRLIVTFNVTDINQPTQLYTYLSQGGQIVNGSLMFDKVNIDNIELSIFDIDTDEGKYQFSTTGEHVVKYTLKDPTFIGLETSTTRIGATFFNCTAITEVIIPNCVTTIADLAFNSCSSLTSIAIPNSVTSIGQYAFYGSSLISVTIPSGVTSIGQYAFAYCSDLTNVTIFNNVTTIGEGAFGWCTSLTSIIIPDSVTIIGDGAFYNCTGLTTVTIGNNVTSIGTSAFYNCTGLTTVTIPDSVITIGEGAFVLCAGLTSITSLATTPPSIQDTTFKDVKSGGTLYVPQGTTVTGYGNWMRTDDYYLGKYGWNIVEI